MRQFLLKLLLFLFVIVIVDRVFGIVMDSVLRNTEKGDWGRNNYILNEVQSDVVILGSSRAIHHYNPQIFADSLGMSCYNCGEDGMGILLMCARYHAIRERYIPKLVIYEVLPEFDILQNRDNLKYLKFLRPYYDSPYIGNVIRDVSLKEPVKLQSMMYRYNSAFVDMIAQNLSSSPFTARDYTYSPVIGQMNYNPKEQVGGGWIKPVDSLKIAYVRNLILQCQKDGTRLFFVASPIYRPMSDEEFAPLKGLCQVYDVPFINHYCDTNYCDNSLFFADASHLNLEGSESFTSFLASEIKQMK